MGMFDDIIVPKSYLKGLLTKQQEKLIKDNNYQTKSLENCLHQYKIHRQKLFIKEEKKWTEVAHTGTVDFYNSIKDKKGDLYWVDFRFLFEDGVVDKKELVKYII